MKINHNIQSMIAQGALNGNERTLAKSLQRISTGLRITRASDDAAGLSVSETLRTQINGSKVAMSNASDGIALLQIAEGAANEIGNILQRMRELSVQSTNDTLTTVERSYTNQEYQALSSEIDRITNVTQYNTQTLLDGVMGSFGAAGSASSVLHIGPNAKSIDRITISIQSTSTGALTVGGTSITSQSRAENAIQSVDVAINSVNQLRSNLGAYINRLEHAIVNLDNQMVNNQAAESGIRDVDFATESAAFTRSQILVQSATSMLAQANSVSQNVLQLLR